MLPKNKKGLTIVNPFLYLRPESNRHARNGHRILSPARLPIPPLRHLSCYKKSRHFIGTLSGKRDSNSRPRPWQGRALPTELFPRCCLMVQRYAFSNYAQVFFKLFFIFFKIIFYPWKTNDYTTNKFDLTLKFILKTIFSPTLYAYFHHKNITKIKNISFFQYKQDQFKSNNPDNFTIIFILSEKKKLIPYLQFTIKGTSINCFSKDLWIYLEKIIVKA